ncbi:MAG: prolipoprotein diacylglyceryl transferase [Bacteroidota bacterium]
MILINILTYITWSVDPDIFTIPFIDHPVRWYGVLFASAFIITQQVMYFVYKKEGRSRSEIDTLTVYMVVGTIIGARLGHVLFYAPSYYFQHPLKILAVWEGGLASHGAAISLPIALYLFARRTKVGYRWLLDRMVIVVSLAGCMIRLGNLMNSEMIGLPTDLPWGFIFTSVDNVPRHPAQLYEAIYCLILSFILFGIWYRYRSRIQDGSMFGWFLITIFGLRIVDEFFKVNQESFEDGMTLNMGQILSIPLVITGIIILLSNLRKSKAMLNSGSISSVDQTPPIDSHQ